jgi:endo-1,4-beta-xylanase
MTNATYVTIPVAACALLVAVGFTQGGCSGAADNGNVAATGTGSDASAGYSPSSGGGSSESGEAGVSASGGLGAASGSGGVSSGGLGTGGTGATGGSGLGAGAGVSASGGFGATGGSSVGGNADTGGSSNAGGSSNTGGRSWRSSGGSSTGGSSAAGGDSATGGGSGTATGGSSGTGGSTDAGGSPPLTKKFVGNITSRDTVDSSGRRFADYWDQITPENAGKWGSVQRSAGSYNWGTLDAIYDYTESNDIIFKEHTFIWGSQQPGFSIGENEVKAWMSAFCSRYPNTKLIDVVNEPPPHTTPSYANSIGGGTNGSWQWIINAFKWAGDACPNAILILNDYNVIEWSGDNDRMIEIAKTVKAAGAPIDAIGAQAHDLDKVGFSTVKNLLTKLHDGTGLPIYITEYDPSTSNDQQQLDWYKEQVPYLYEQDYVHGITIWGWIYGQTWSMAPESGLIRNNSPRPAMTWLMDYLGRTAP